MVDGVLDSYALKVIDLTAAQYGWKNLVLLRCSQNEDDVVWRFFKGLQECVEGLLREHVDLVDNEHLVTSHLWRYAHLVNQFTDVVNRIVRGGIQFMYIHRTTFIEGTARFALAARFALRTEMFAVDGLCKYTCTGGFSNPTRTAEKICMSQLSSADGIEQCGGESTLTYNHIERCRTVFASRNYVLFHLLLLIIVAKIQINSKLLIQNSKLFVSLPQIFNIVMSSIQTVWEFLRRYKYFVVLAFFAIVVGFVDEDSFWDRHQRLKEIDALRAEMQSYQNRYERDTKALEELESSQEEVVRVAREQYLMKYPNEDVYVFMGEATSNVKTETNTETEAGE